MQNSFYRRTALIAHTLLSAVFALPLSAQEIVHRDDLQTVFDQQSVNGGFASFNVAENQLTVVNSTRAEHRYIPASTFKIVNSLIALETGVVADENEIVPYGSKPQPIEEWEADMSLRDGISISNVPVFQEIARRVGLPRYEKYLKMYGFGNQQVGSDVEMFWLTGPLKVSATEYAYFLSKLATGNLPASPENQAIVRDIIRLEAKGTAVLYGKTGWTTYPDPDIGWFVGWVERDGDLTTFALNIDIRHRDDAAKRIVLAKALLAELGVY
ncbi:class D beta-lactamase [Halovulum sp. GXIMD14793]